MYALSILMDQYVKPDVITLVSKHPEPIPHEHANKGKRGTRKPKQNSAPIIQSGTASDKNPQPR